MEYKKAGKYRPLNDDDDKKITKRERRLGRVVVEKQVNYTQKEWKAKKHKEAEARRKKNSKKYEYPKIPGLRKG